MNLRVTACEICLIPYLQDSRQKLHSGPECLVLLTRKTGCYRPTCSIANYAALYRLRAVSYASEQKSAVFVDFGAIHCCKE